MKIRKVGIVLLCRTQVGPHPLLGQNSNFWASPDQFIIDLKTQFSLAVWNIVKALLVTH